MCGEVIQNIFDNSKGVPGNEEVCKLSDLLLKSPLFTYTYFKHTKRNCMFCSQDQHEYSRFSKFHPKLLLIVVD